MFVLKQTWEIKSLCVIKITPRDDRKKHPNFWSGVLPWTLVQLRNGAFWQLPFPAHPFRMGDSRLNILIGWMRAHQWKREDSIRRLRQGIISVSYVSLDLTVLEKQWQWPSCRILISIRYATVEIRMQASFMADGLSDYPSCTSVRPW